MSPTSSAALSMTGKTKGIKLRMKGKKGSKSSAKKLLKKIQKSKLTNASIDDLAPAPLPSPISEPVKSSDSASVTDITEASTEDMNNSEPIPGFIFLCNRKTKARCFQHQVFGLPLFQMKSVEKIKPGTKLFLFDYGMRLLHGIYEAASEGKDNVDPDAFEGKFLAQVKFRIVKECLPVPERFFKNCVLENYHGGRLMLELSEQQVNRLVPLFRPLVSSSSSSEPVDMVLPNAAASQPLLPTRVEDQYHKNLNRRQSLQTVNSQPIQSVYQQPAAVAVANQVHPSYQQRRNQVHPSSHQRRAPNPVNSYNADSQGLYSSTRGNSYNAHSQGIYSSTRGNSYNAHSQGLYSTRGYTVVMQEPYARYITEPEWLLQNHTMGLGNDYHSWALMREPLYSGHCPHQHNSFSTMQPNAPVYGIPEVPYLAYASSGRPQANYAVPYVSTAMPAYVAASAWPNEHYPMTAASYDASSMMFPYATASGWHEPNHPMPAASYVTMPRGGTAAGIPVPNVPMSSHFTYLGPNRFFN